MHTEHETGFIIKLTDKRSLYENNVVMVAWLEMERLDTIGLSEFVLIIWFAQMEQFIS